MGKHEHHYKIIEFPQSPGSDDDDMGAFWRDYEAWKKDKRAKNFESFHSMIEVFAKLPSFKKHSEWHYSFALNGDRVDYWPSRNKWSYKKRVTTGTTFAFLNWIKNRRKETTHDTSLPPTKERN